MHATELQLDNPLEARRQQKFALYRSHVVRASRGEDYDTAAVEALLRDLGMTPEDFRRHVNVCRARRIAATTMRAKAAAAVEEEQGHRARLKAIDEKLAAAKAKYEKQAMELQEKRRAEQDSWKSRVAEGDSHRIKRLSDLILSTTRVRTTKPMPYRRTQIETEIRQLQYRIHGIDPVELQHEVRNLEWEFDRHRATTKPQSQFDDPLGLCENVDQQNIEHRLIRAKSQLQLLHEVREKIEALQAEDRAIVRRYRQECDVDDGDVDVFDWSATDVIVVEGKAISLAHLKE